MKIKLNKDIMFGTTLVKEGSILNVALKQFDTDTSQTAWSVKSKKEEEKTNLEDTKNSFRDVLRLGHIETNIQTLDRVIAKAKKNLDGLHIDVECDPEMYECKPGHGNEYDFDMSQDPGGEGASTPPSSITTSKTAFNKRNIPELFSALNHALQLKQSLYKSQGEDVIAYELQNVINASKELSRSFMSFSKSRTAFNKYNVEDLFDALSLAFSELRDKALSKGDLQESFDIEDLERVLNQIIAKYDLLVDNQQDIFVEYP